MQAGGCFLKHDSAFDAHDSKTQSRLAGLLRPTTRPKPKRICASTRAPTNGTVLV